MKLVSSSIAGLCVATAAFVALLATAASAGDDEYEREWTRLSAAHDRLIATEAGRDYERRLTEVHNGFWQSLYAQCIDGARKQGLTSFRAIAVVDENGTVTKFLTLPNRENLACFAKGMVGRRYPAPPTAPFYERFSIFVVGD
jgi:hypothetical protein